MSTLSHGQEFDDVSDGESELYYRPRKKNRRTDEDNPNNISEQPYQNHAEDFNHASYLNSNEEPASLSINNVQIIQPQQQELEQQSEPQQPIMSDFSNDDNGHEIINISDEPDSDNDQDLNKHNLKSTKTISQQQQMRNRNGLTLPSFSCPTLPLSCRKKFKNLIRLQNHMKREHPSNDPSPKRFCYLPGCKMDLSNAVDLLQHIKQHDMERKTEMASSGIPQKLSCPVHPPLCRKKFKLLIRFQRHMKREHPTNHPPPKRFCYLPGCGKYFSSVQHLTQHVKQHDIEREKKKMTSAMPQQVLNESPDSPGEEFNSLPLRQQHYQAVLIKSGLYTCQFKECRTRAFQRPDSIQAHMKAKHNILLTTLPPIIEKHNQHIGEQRHKVLDGPWKCPFGDCKYKTTQSRKAIHHTRLHQGDKCAFPCEAPDCGVSFTSWSLLRRHSLFIHDETPTNNLEVRWKRGDSGQPRKRKKKLCEAVKEEEREEEEEERAVDDEKTEDNGEDLEEKEEEQQQEGGSNDDPSEGQEKISHDENFQNDGEQKKLVVVKEEPPDVASASQNLDEEQEGERAETIMMMPIKVERIKVEVVSEEEGEIKSGNEQDQDNV